MKCLVAKDKRRRDKYNRGEWSYRVMKALSMNQKIKIEERVEIQDKMKRFRDMSKVKIKNRCYLTGRARAVYRAVHMTRMKFKENIEIGKLRGIKRGKLVEKMAGLNNLLANIRGGYKTNRVEVKVRNTEFNRKILRLIYEEGYILSWNIIDRKYLKVKMRYLRKRPAITYLKRISTEARIRYMKKIEIEEKYGLGMKIVLENKRGLCVYRYGKEMKGGGKVLFEIR